LLWRGILKFTQRPRLADVPQHARRRLAALAMQRTAAYDMAIARWLGDLADENADSQSPTTTAHLARLFPDHRIAQALRYGENPHQEAVYLEPPNRSAYRQLSGKELSYNNLLDLDAAWAAVNDFDTATCVIVKHGSPCGIASAPTMTPYPIADLVKRAIAADPVSAFGGILVTNRPLDLDAALATAELFLEIAAAPEVTPEAAAHLARTKKNCRVLVMARTPRAPMVRSALGGLLVQTPDHLTPEPTLFKAATTFTTPDLELCAFAWSTVKHLKSNAIAVCLRDGDALVTAGLGAGQTNRIDATRQALDRARERYPDLAERHAVLASDAFFPLADGVEAASRFYFGKSVREITMAEAAVLAGLFKAPTKYAPHVNISASRSRTNDVLSNMVEAGFFSAGQVHE
ncbi:MAG TPA: transglycosylase domain-containing protein, partial [Myxococcota bacterium]|nr:transglycosylase domain-containing protein [Myxococcota bacterium]